MLPIIGITILLFVPLGSVDGRREGFAESKADRIRSRDRQSLRKEIFAEVLENVCDVTTPVSVYCYCDSLSLQDATRADCWIFNVTDDNDLIWHSFSTQAHLQELRFKLRPDGRLHFIPQIVLQNLSNLTHFEIFHAEIGTVVSNIFNSSVSLEKLVLRRNKIGKINREAFLGLGNLRSLILSENYIGHLERGIFDGLMILNTLQLDRNNISLIEDDTFSSLKHLSELDLSNNKISVLAPETLTGLQSLQYLYLQNNMIEVIGDNAFVHTTQLVHLDLQANHIKMIHSNGFRNLKYLAYLNLQGNHLMQLGIHTWTGLKNLIDLNLKNNKIGILNHTIFSPLWSNLVNESMKFSLEGNPLVCDCNLLWLTHLHNVTHSSNVQQTGENLNCLQNDTEWMKLMQVLPSLQCAHLPSDMEKTVVATSFSEVMTSNTISTTLIPPSMSSSSLPTTQPFLYQDERQSKRLGTETRNESAAMTHSTTEPGNAKFVTRQLAPPNAKVVISYADPLHQINSSKQVDQSSGVQNSRLSISFVLLSATFTLTFWA